MLENKVIIQTTQRIVNDLCEALVRVVSVTVSSVTSCTQYGLGPGETRPQTVPTLTARPAARGGPPTPGRRPRPHGSGERRAQPCGGVLHTHFSAWGRITIGSSTSESRLVAIVRVRLVAILVGVHVRVQPRWDAHG